MADARPVSAGAMFAYVAACMGTKAHAIAIPRANMIGRISHRLVARPRQASGNISAAMPSMPNTSSRRGTKGPTALLWALRERVQNERQSGDRQHEASYVEPSCLSLSFLTQVEEPDRERQHPDRQVHVEDPAP